MNELKPCPFCCGAKQEVAREIFAEIEEEYADFLFDGYRNIIVLTEKDFAELKKKYTESENNDG